MGYGFPVRCHRRRPQTVVPESDRRAQPPLPGHLGGQTLQAKDVVRVLEELTSLKPAPAFIRSDNGPEFIPQALRDWCEASTTTSTAYIAPGPPLGDRIHGIVQCRFLDDFLNTELFTTALEAQILADR